VARTAVIAGTATAVSNRVSRRQAGRWADQEQQQAYQQQQTYYQQQPYPPQQPYPQQAYEQPAEAPADMSSQLTQLKQLGELKDQGILTEAEFEAQKQKILGG
jgi:hypothetical protein